ncbi:TolC family protein [Opitutus terrae]|uniref:Outer membrane efflux protein n=1 Tax=Opitutus terrae (strain DSM 11246 / JCM 15787 / PB90-1) TaxID=452637 RepID=B1ZTW2_OPITP|nr:TolC family protein [Opitutus terrae]ACB75844.1 outer membrane efflux protein [Opitutus terrae PB90-1]
MSRFTARVFALILAAFTGFVCAEEPAAPPPLATAPTLTVEECIVRALEKNFSIKVQSFSSDVARESLAVAQAAFEPTFTASLDRRFTQDALVLGGARNDYSSARLGVSQLVPTGARLNVSTNLDRNAGSFTSGTGRYTSGPFNPIYGNDVVLTVTQPLLRGAGLAVNRAAIERTKLGVEIAHLDLQGQVLQVIRDTEAAYFNLVFAREQLAVKQHSLRLAERLYEENKTRKLTGVATDLDVLTAEVGIANARNGVVVAEQGVHNREDELLALIGQFEFDSSLGTVGLTPYHEPTPSFDLSYKLARDNQPDFLATQTVIRQLEIDARNARNSRLPTLDLDGAVGYSGVDRSYRGAVDRTSNGEAENWQLGLSVSVPWGLHADRARYRAALASLRQQETRLRQLDQNLLVQVRTAVRAVETNQQSVEINAKATELATRQYELELARFKAGLSTSRQVLQIQDDLETTRVNELLARVNLRIAIANLHQLEASSLQRYHVAVGQ